MSRRVRLWHVVLILVVFNAGIAIALTYNTPTSGTVPLGADAGPEAGITCGCDINASGYVINATAANISTAQGHYIIDGTADGYARVDRPRGAWTNLSQIDTAGGNIVFDPDDKQHVMVNGSMTSFAWRPKSETARDDGQNDFVYSASGTAGASIAGVAPNANISAYDTDSNTLLADADSDASGRVVFDGLNAGNHDVRLQKTPGTLEVRNETSPSNLVTGSSVSIEFYLDEDTASPDMIVERSASNGRINMTGLPVNESFVVVADADGYLPRRIWVENLYEQETVYLFPESKVHVEKVFALTDYTGLYEERTTVLMIQRNIQGQWRTVQADYFGATGEYRAQLDRNVRHRMILYNTANGQRRPLGPFTPLSSGTQEIQVQSDGDIDLQRIGPIVTASPSIRVLPATQGAQLTLSVRDKASTVTAWNYTIHHLNGSSTTLAQQTFTSASSEDLTLNLNNETGRVVAEVGWQTDDGRDNVRNFTYRVRPQFQNNASVLHVLTTFPNLLSDSDADAFTTVVAILTSILAAAVVGSKFRVSTETIGLVAIGGLAGWSIIGWTGYGVVFGGGVAWVGMTAIRRGL